LHGDPKAVKRYVFPRFFQSVGYPEPKVPHHGRHHDRQPTSARGDCRSTRPDFQKFQRHIEDNVHAQEGVFYIDQAEHLNTRLVIMLSIIQTLHTSISIGEELRGLYVISNATGGDDIDESMISGGSYSTSWGSTSR